MGLFRKQRIFRETVKDQQTSHWDLDLLSHDELTALMAQRPQDESQNVTPKRAAAGAKDDRAPAVRHKDDLPR